MIEMRRLLPVASVRRQARSLAVLDTNGKIVTRLRVDCPAASPPGRRRRRQAMSPRLTIIPIRGYARAFREARRFAARELELPECDSREIVLALAALGQVAGRYSSKLRIELDAGMRADSAAKTILRALHATIVDNEDGTRANLDSEFLHDFRVAVRRTRSCLSQLKSLFRPRGLGKFPKEFAWLARLTGPTRDLDVYLLKMEAYRKSLPKAVQRELEPLEEFLRERQAVEHERLATALVSKRYRALIRNWKRFIDTEVDETEAPVDAKRPILEVASERIGKCHRRVMKRGRAIGADVPAEKLHRLRIECKKLRYLLEFFASLYDPATLGALVRELKLLQDNLGDFNDLEVQQGALLDFAHQMQEEGSATVEMLMAMGRLREQLEERQDDERKRFAKRFARFSSRKNLARVLELLPATPGSQVGAEAEDPPAPRSGEGRES
jgi:CHAD domain-containing protein